MPVPHAVPETSVPRSHNLSQSARGRPAVADAAPHPFSALLDSVGPAQDAAVPDRADPADRTRSERSRRADKATAESPRDSAKATKAKQRKDVQDAKKNEDAKPGESQDAAGDTSDVKETETTADAGKNGDGATGEIEIDPSLLTAEAAGAQGGNSVLTFPVLAPAPALAPAAVADEIGQVAAVTDESVASAAGLLLAAAAAKTEAAQTVQATDATFKQAVADSKAGGTPARAITAAHAPTHDLATNAQGVPTPSDGAEANGKSAEGHAQGDVASTHAPRGEPRPELQVSGDDPNSAARTNADPSANVGPLPPLRAVATAAVTTQPTLSNAIAVPVAGLAVEIAARAQTGKNRFEIRLDPPELGRINVRLDLDHDGNVTSHLVVDRAETLDLLRRDASNLERALQQAGLKTSDNGLQFSLRDQSFSGRDNSGQTTADMARLIVPDDQIAPIEPTQRSYGRLAGLGGGVDIRV
jgi:flagellar hook-length control protein FliK